MRECGEDLLVDMSEILFNELAFFRLMQDLDDPGSKAKARMKQWSQVVLFLSIERVVYTGGGRNVRISLYVKLLFLR